LWDIRKIRAKKTDLKPISIFENIIETDLYQKSDCKYSLSKNIKGYSNLLFNNNRTLLYANCMNNYIYEYNFFTYNNNHTRILNKCETSEREYTFNLNQSNFIKSSLSNCDNFILTGSSDYNAYIYPTKFNNIPFSLKNRIPVIVLKGHSNEVTTVDWNPLDSNQLITCSDDNTIRIWNVEREFEIITSKASECNFFKADILFDNDINLNKNIELEKDKIEIKPNLEIKYILNYSNIYNDYIFKITELKKNSRNIKCDLEDELCLRYEKIDIHNENIKNSVKKKISNNCFEYLQDKPDLLFKDFKRPLSNLPINLIPASFDEFRISNELDLKSTPITQNSKNLNGFVFRRQNSSNTLISVSSYEQNLIRKKMKAKIINRQKNINNYETPKRKEKSTHLESSVAQNIVQPKLSSSTSKKRNVLFCLNEHDTYSADNEIKTPRSKKRLLMTDQTESLKSFNDNNLYGSPRRTILDYFSQKENDK
jgi:hypothetical protein